MPDEKTEAVAEKVEESKTEASSTENAELTALKEQLATATEKLGASGELKKNVAVLFDNAATEGERAEALQSVMVAGGIDSGDAIQLMTQIQSANVEENQAVEGDETKAKTENPGEEKKESTAVVDQIMGRLGELEKTQKAANEANAEAARGQAQVQLKSEVANSFQQDKEMKLYVERITLSKGEEAAKKVVAFLEKDVMRDTMERLYSRKAKVGFFDNRWISEEASKAVAATLEKARAFGATDLLGKTPSGVDDMAAYAELAQEKLEPPKYDRKKSTSELNAEVTEWTRKRFEQLAARTALKGPSKA